MKSEKQNFLIRLSNFVFAILGNYPAVYLCIAFLWIAKKTDFFIFDITYIFIVTILFYYLLIVRLLSLNWKIVPICDWCNREIAAIKRR